MKKIKTFMRMMERQERDILTVRLTKKGIETVVFDTIDRLTDEHKAQLKAFLEQAVKRLKN